MEQKQDIDHDALLAQRLQELEFEESDEKTSHQEEKEIFHSNGTVEFPISDDIRSRLYHVMQEQKLSSMDETVQFLIQYSHNHETEDMDIS